MRNVLINWVRRSNNKKTGPIATTITPRKTCPQSCPLYKGSCYAEGYGLRFVWNRVDEGKSNYTITFEQFLKEVRKLHKDELWRHCQAGDQIGEGEKISRHYMSLLVEANKIAGARGFTFTHKPLTPENKRIIKHANKNGFTINLSADSLEQADDYLSQKCGPVVVTVPSDHPKISYTPAGHKVVICPEQQEHSISTCQTCGICAKADRKIIVGFKAHGVKHKQLDMRLKVSQT